MISLKCKNCAGEMSVDLKGELVCPYCGSRNHFSDVEFAEYKNFRLNLLYYLRASADAAADAADDTFLWSHHDNVNFTAANGVNVSIDYLFCYEEDYVKTYVARDSVIFIFDDRDKHKIDDMISGIGMLDYPSADLKNLDKYFPKMKSRIELKDNKTLVAFSKPENVYPLYAFGNLKPEHAAWVVSRLENFACVFEFSGIVHNGLSINSVFINPRTHEAYLYGGWWKARRKRSLSKQNDLNELRKIASKLMGQYIADAPKEFKEFISGRPAEDAYADFGKWDEVIEKGFGGHKFIKLDM